MVEFGVPRRRVLRAGWTLHTRLGLPLAGRVVSKDWYEVGRFLGPSIAGFYRQMPLPRLRELWEDAGVRDVRIRRMSFGAGVVMWGERDGVDA
jgi:hypothetical protein